MNSTKLIPTLLTYRFNRMTASRTKIRGFCCSRYNQPNWRKCINVTSLMSDGHCRFYSDEKGSNNEDKDAESSESVSSSMNNFKIFKDYDSQVILDIDEERKMFLENPELFLQQQQKEKKNEFFGLNLDRGKNGVFEVEELVKILRNDSAINVVTISVPTEFRYVDYIVIVSGRSFKHLYSMAEFVMKLFKRKRHDSDRIPKIEGMHLSSENPSNWIAMDLGNIALHMFLEPVRRKYDLETLWAVGREYDDLYNAKIDDYIEFLQQHTLNSLDGLQPLNESEELA